MENCSRCGGTIPPSASAASTLCGYCAPATVAEPAIGTAAVLSLPSFPVTRLLVTVNVLVFVAMVLLGVSPTGPNVVQAIRWGADFGPLTLGGQFWRLLTSNYVHFGIVHLFLNMWCLWGLGKLTESFYSRVDYLLLYTFTGIAGSLLSVGLRPYTVGAGASGAIFGLAGVLMATLQWGDLPIAQTSRRSLFKSIFQFAGINLVIGLGVSRIDNTAHIGGLLFGLLIGAVMGRRLGGFDDSRGFRRLAWIMLATTLVAATALVVHFRK